MFALLMSGHFWPEANNFGGVAHSVAHNSPFPFAPAFATASLCTRLNSMSELSVRVAFGCAIRSLLLSHEHVSCAPVLHVSRPVNSDRLVDSASPPAAFPLTVTKKWERHEKLKC